MANYMALALRQAARRHIELVESELVEYNPYHDSRGRFTSAGGAGGGRGGKGGMVVPRKGQKVSGRASSGLIGRLAGASAAKAKRREAAMFSTQGKSHRGSTQERADSSMVQFRDRQSRAAHKPTIAGRMRKAELGTRRSPAMQRRFKSQAGTQGVANRRAIQRFVFNKAMRQGAKV